MPPDSAACVRKEGGLRLRGREAMNSSVPRVTVAIVAFNAANTLAEAIESVRQQSTRSLIELIIVDGGSHDNTLDLLEASGDAIDYWISEPDGGIYDAMNKALQLAKGRWLLFLGADDVLEPGFSEAINRLHSDEVIYYGDVRLKSTGALYAGRFNTYKMMQQNLHHQSMFYPACVYRSKPYDSRIKYLADYKYNIELWGSKTPFEYLNCVIATYNDQGVSSRGDESFEAIRGRLIRQHFGKFYYTLKVARTALARLRPARQQ